MLTKIKELRNLMAGNYTLNTEWIEAIFPTVPFVQDEHHFHEFPLSIPFFQFGANVNEEPEEVKKTNAFEVIFELYSKNMSSKNYYEKIIRDLIKHSVVARNFFFSKQEKRLESEIASWLEDMENVTNELDKIIDDYDNASGEKFLDTMTLGELKELTPLIDWTKILSHFNSQINSNTHIEIKCVECIEKWQKFSLENKFQIKQYLEMIIVEKYYLPVMKLREDFEKSGINKKQYCINKTKEHFDWVIDRLFIEHIKFPGTIRKDIKLFFEKYKKLFVEIISKNVWMSEKDKEKALERARQIEFEPAYFYGDIKLDKHFNELNRLFIFISAFFCQKIFLCQKIQTKNFPK
uniref:Peptidase_M13_N domain-containing protein n=1 Tax=Meloidogyne hapla TaxID=6305 RepID=A0A1I8BV00_MELHA